jgi:hypothetical protein
MDNFSRARSSVDRAVDFGSTGREFESLRAHHGGFAAKVQAASAPAPCADGADVIAAPRPAP